MFLQKRIVPLVEHGRLGMCCENGGETVRHAAVAVHLDVDAVGLEPVGVGEAEVAEYIDASGLYHWRASAEEGRTLVGGWFGEERKREAWKNRKIGARDGDVDGAGNGRGLHLRAGGSPARERARRGECL